MCLTISPKLLYQMGRAFVHFVVPELSFYTGFIGSTLRLNKKAGGKNLFFSH